MHKNDKLMRLKFIFKNIYKKAFLRIFTPLINFFSFENFHNFNKFYRFENFRKFENFHKNENFRNFEKNQKKYENSRFWKKFLCSLLWGSANCPEKKLAYLIFENGFVLKIPAFFFLPAKSCPTFSAAISPCFCPAFVLPKSCQISDVWLLAVVVLPRAALLTYPFFLLTSGFFLAIVWSLRVPIRPVVVLVRGGGGFFLATNGFSEGVGIGGGIKCFLYDPQMVQHLLLSPEWAHH